jgi:hypothetical protein
MFQVLRQIPLDQARRRFPTGEAGITGWCSFKLTATEINADTGNVVYETVVLNADPLVSFLIKF